MTNRATLSAGDEIWIPCEVKPGPFTDERMVRVGLPDNQWVGFAPAWALKNPDVSEGRTEIRAKVVEVEDEYVSVRLPGHAIAASVFRSPKEEVAAVGSM